MNCYCDVLVAHIHNLMCALEHQQHFDVFAGYNKWRKFCGLTTAIRFERMVDITDPAVIRKFRALYRRVAFSTCTVIITHTHVFVVQNSHMHSA